MRVTWPERLRLDVPVVQAPLGGGISSPELAAAVSNAGGFGTIGIRAPASILRDFAHARALALGKPLGLGLLVPFTRRAVVEYSALYAGETAKRIHTLESAFEVTLGLRP